MTAAWVAELHRLARDLDSYRHSLVSGTAAAPLGLGARLARLDRALAPLAAAPEAAEADAQARAALAAALRLQLDGVARLAESPESPDPAAVASAVAALRRLAAALLAAEGS